MPIALPRSSGWKLAWISASEPGRQQRRARALQEPRADEELDVRRDPAQHRGDGEPQHAEQEDLLAAEAVTERPAEQHERGEREQIAVDRPLQTRDVGVEVGADVRQRDIDDGAVEERHAGREDRGEQDAPAGRRLQPQRFRGGHDPGGYAENSASDPVRIEGCAPPVPPSSSLPFSSTGCVPLEAPVPAETTSPESAAQLGQLTVASAGSMRGYSRDRFPHWREAGSNCDVRDKVLERDGTAIRRRGCNVVGGRWFSTYDERTFTDPSDVDIDHMVPLANAWRSGRRRVERRPAGRLRQRPHPARAARRFGVGQPGKG